MQSAKNRFHELVGKRHGLGKYIPGGPGCNVQPAVIRNRKVAMNVAQAYSDWVWACFPSKVHKPDPQPLSLSSIKKQHRCTRAVARTILEGLGSAVNESHQASV